MPWVRDLQSPRGTWLRTLVVLGLVFAIVAESPLRQSWGALTWLNPGGTGTVAESVLPPLDVLGEPDLAAAAKRKRNAQHKDTAGKHKQSKAGTPGDDKSEKQNQPTPGTKQEHSQAGQGQERQNRQAGQRQSRQERQ